jgi:DMSO/TMAO reductase YedYZ heme-binding membrane subunit
VRLLLLIALAIAAMCAAIVAATGGGAEAAHAVVRWTARTSLLLFAFAYVARPAVQLVPSPATKWLLANRKWIGLGFATSHAAHLVGIVAIAWPDPRAFVAAQDPTIVVAVLAYVLIGAMAVTSIERVKRAMSKRAWTGLHRTGIHVFWFVFAFTYVGRVGVAPIYAIPVVALVLIAAIRFAAFLRIRRRAAERRAVQAA